MDKSIALRIDGNARQWGGNNSPQEERNNRRRLKLNALLLSLRAGDLEAASQAFAALVSFDPSLLSDPYLSKIGTALESSNLYVAQHFGVEFQNRGGQLQLPANKQIAEKIGERQKAQNIYAGLIRVDISA